MEKVHEGVINAINSKKNYACGKAAVIVNKQAVTLSYCGNAIFKDYGCGHKSFTLAGWNTPTTRRYLNAVGVDVRCIKGQPIAYGCPIEDNAWYDVYDN